MKSAILDQVINPIIELTPIEVSISPSINEINSAHFKTNPSYRIIHIPTHITSIEPSTFDPCPLVHSIIVDSNNQFFISLNDILFSKDQCTLIRHPPKHPNQQFMIPSNVTTIESSAFYYCSNLTHISVENGNGAFVSNDGILFSKDLQTLICYPCGYPNSIYNIPSSVTSISDFAFFYCLKLESITIPSSVTSIGNKVFVGCEKLKQISVEIGNSVFASNDGILFTKDMQNLICYPRCHPNSNYDIPEGVTSIGDCSFYHCTSLVSITIPSGVTSIGKSAFSHCTNLSSISLPSSLTSIGEFAFFHCSHLLSITIPSSVASIGNKVFEKCEKLKRITVESGNSAVVSNDGILFTKDMRNLICYPRCHPNSNYDIPDGVTFISDYAFHDCFCLKSITIPSSVTSIGDYAFHHCTLLESITIPSSVTSIGDSAFSHCTNLSAIAIPSMVTSIREVDLFRFSYLKSITIPSSVASIGNKVFEGCEKIKQITVEPGNSAVVSNDGILFTKDMQTLICCPSRLSNYIYNIPTSVTSIADSAFYHCIHLESITIPSSVTSIGDSAFFACSKLRFITIPSSVISIGHLAFARCSKLTHVLVENPNSTYVSMDGILFTKDMQNLICYPRCHPNSIYDIPEGVTSIDDYAFYQCTNLVSITIPSSATSIGEFAFYLCDHLSTIIIPSSVISIRKCAFYKCSALESITIPSSVTSIEQFAFFQCSIVKSITIPSSVTSIGNKAFAQCNHLEQFVVETGNSAFVSIDGILFTKDMQTLICCPSQLPHSIYNIPLGVTSIGDFAFDHCQNLVSITIPFGVTSIGTAAFHFCSQLSSITIPSSVTTIGKLAFYSCLRLSSITIPSSVTSIGTNALPNGPNFETIFTSLDCDSFKKMISFNCFHNDNKVYICSRA